MSSWPPPINYQAPRFDPEAPGVFMASKPAWAPPSEASFPTKAELAAMEAQREADAEAYHLEGLAPLVAGLKFVALEADIYLDLPAGTEPAIDVAFPPVEDPGDDDLNIYNLYTSHINAVDAACAQAAVRFSDVVAPVAKALAVAAKPVLAEGFMAGRPIIFTWKDRELGIMRDAATEDHAYASPFEPDDVTQGLVKIGHIDRRGPSGRIHFATAVAAPLQALEAARDYGILDTSITGGVATGEAMLENLRRLELPVGARVPTRLGASALSTNSGADYGGVPGTRVASLWRS